MGRNRRSISSNSFLSSGFNEVAVAFDERRAQAVIVLVQSFQRQAFGAQMTRAEHIGVMPANARHRAAADLDCKAAASLVQVADAVVGGVIG